MTAFLSLVAHFVCPLLFFTNFTRNPYQTQITFLHLSILGIILAVLARWAKTSADNLLAEILTSNWPRAFWPLLVFTVVCWISWAVSWFSHTGFFGSSIVAEGLRVNLFWIANVLLAAGVGFLAGRRLRGRHEELFAIDGPVLAGGLVFGLGWIFFRGLKSAHPPSGADTIVGFLGDPYGFFLWAGILAWYGYRWYCRGPVVLITINYTAGLLASLYGVGQYFGHDIIWIRNIGYYGSRAISTFGNPNFLSPYLAVLLPCLAVGYLRSRQVKEKILYGALFFVFEAGLLVTMARSAWAGALVGLGLAIYLLHRETKSFGGQTQTSPVLGKPLLAGFAVFLGLFVCWPQGADKTSPNPAGRFLETRAIIQQDPANPAYAYQPFFQRILIWSSCWQFVRERPLLGKGWGTLELFYPFYQSSMLYQPRYRALRTHANNGHNEIIEVWSQTGILGMGVFIWFFVLFFTWTSRNIRSIASGTARIFGCAAIAGLAGMLADNMLNVSLHFAMPGYLFWWLAGVLVALYPQSDGNRLSAISNQHRGEKSEKVPSLSSPITDHRSPITIPLFRWCAAGVLGLGLIAMGVRFTRYWLSEFYYFRGFVLHREGNMNLALKRLETSRRLFPYEVNRNYELGNVYARLGDSEKAIWAYGQALQANAGYDEIYFNRATILATLGRPEEALKDYLASIHINPTNQGAYQRLTTWVFLKDVPRYSSLAINVLSRAVHFFPQDKEILNNLASFYSQIGDVDNAARYFLQALGADPAYDVTVRNMRNLIADLARKGQRARAEEWMRRWQEQAGPGDKR
ncbi:MAG: tetratricopeptide repeat protein [Elusimicrobia bacterium]|nr:tetratricopeptide repeat protein [Elusimicrobiota bacterium]